MAEDRIIDDERQRRALQNIAIIGGAALHGGPLLDTLQMAGYPCSHFPHPDGFLKVLRKHNCDMVVTELVVADVDALALLTAIKAQRRELLVVLLTVGGNIPAAVEAFKLGAADFVVDEGGDPKQTLARIDDCFSKAPIAMEKMPRELTNMERNVLKHVLLGLSNRETAERIELSVRTVEDHRRRIMQKLGVSNIVELVRLCISSRIIRPDSEQ